MSASNPEQVRAAELEVAFEQFLDTPISGGGTFRHGWTLQETCAAKLGFLAGAASPEHLCKIAAALLAARSNGGPSGR